jgi:hypothetical protein
VARIVRMFLKHLEQMEERTINLTNHETKNKL